MIDQLLRWLGTLLVLVLVACAGDSVDVASDTVSESGADQGAVSADDAAGDAAEADTDDASPKAERRERAVSVQAVEAVRRDLVVPVHAEGSIRARHSADLRFELGGLVERVHVREGQRVRAGQKLVTLDDRELRLAHEEAEARYLESLGKLAVEEEGYQGSDAERVLAERTAELQELEAEGTISRRERLDRELEIGMEAVRAGAYRRELMEVRSGLAAARADAARLEIELERTVVRAPFAGVVSGIELDPGERVQVGDPVARLVDTARVEAAVSLLESDLARVSVGREALLSLPALETWIPATVDVVDPEVDPESRTCRVLMRLDNSEGRVKPGMFVRAAIAGSVYEDRLLVPRQAVVTRDGRPVIFRVEDDRAQWVYVELGESNDRWVEIASVYQGGPVDAGTPVILDNHLTLSHGAKVKIKKTVTIDDPWLPESESEVDSEDT